MEIQTPEQKVNGLEKGLSKKNKMGLWTNIVLLSFVSLKLFATLTDRSWNIMKVGNENLMYFRTFLFFACSFFLIGIVHFIILIKKTKQ